MQRKLLYIINPIAGKGIFQSIEVKIERYCRSKGIAFDRMHSNPLGDYRKVESRIHEEGFTDVIIAGGDGTVNQVIGSLRHTGIRFGILPTGSGNGLARSARIPMKTDLAIQLLFQESGRLTDGFMVNGKFCCMLSGLGFDATVAHSFARQPSRGLSTYVKEVIRNFNGAKAYPFELSSGGRRLSLHALMISIANANQYGNNFTIAPAASLQDGLLDVVIFLRQSKASFVWQTMRQVLGLNPVTQTGISQPGLSVLYWQTDSIRIQNPEGALLHTDGDPSESMKELHIESIPDAFWLIRKYPS